MKVQPIPLLDVLARWGYSEIVDSNFERCYDNAPDIEALRVRRRNRTQFGELSPAERYNLAFQCAGTRRNLLVYLVSLDAFRLVALTREQIGELIVPPNIWHPDSLDRFVSFSDFMTKTRAQDPRDSRNVVCDAGLYRPPSDPLTIARCYQHSVLLDGYHRAAAFWKYAAGGSLCAYAPDSAATGFLPFPLVTRLS